MKTEIKKVLPVVLFVISLVFGACSENNSSKDIAENQNKETFSDSNKQDKNNAQFVVDVAAANYYEIGLSKFAVVNTVKGDVHDFAEMMVKDHSDALSSLKDVARKQNISIPDEDTARVNDKISKWKKLTPTDFNKVYIDEMVSEHKAAVDKLQKAATGDVTNAGILTWVNKTLPTVQEHLQRVNAISDALSAKK